MSDRIRIRREFRRVLWTCPTCKLEEFEDFNVGDSNEYVHTCNNGHTFNQSCGAMKEYNGCLSYTLEDYDKIDEKAVEEKKDALVSAWVYEIKNPALYTEPDKATLEKLRDEKLAEVARLEEQISLKSLAIEE